MEAIRCLNSLQSNSAIVELAKKRPLETALQSLPKTIKYLARAGIAVEDLDKLNAIHVSGTKGKGSTCAFCECILRKHGLRTGFYSSPHMVAVRERIAINGKPLSEATFASYFWEVYNRLLLTADNPNDIPAYFNFLTVMAFHVFLKENVDVAIIEVGIGGQYDCTNVIRKPVVCGITSLGLDHTAILGSSLDRIAWQKAGIFKPGVPAISVPQEEAAVRVLMRRAAKIGVPLMTSPPLQSHRWAGQAISLGLAGEVQQQNAALAVQLVSTWLQSKMTTREHSDCATPVREETDFPPEASTCDITMEVATGLRECRWPGRHQILHRGKLVCFLDGAHTLESMQSCAHWFRQASYGNKDNYGDQVCRVLLFNSTGDRTPESLLAPLLPCNFDIAIFSPNTVYVTSSTSSDQLKVSESSEKTSSRCKINAKVWSKLAASAEKESCATYVDCISDVLAALLPPSSDYPILGRNGFPPSAITLLQQFSRVHLLVTGSLHLVGGVLSVLDPKLESRESFDSIVLPADTAETVL